MSDDQTGITEWHRMDMPSIQRHARSKYLISYPINLSQTQSVPRLLSTWKAGKLYIPQTIKPKTSFNIASGKETNQTLPETNLAHTRLAKRNASNPKLWAREYVITGPISFVQIHTTHRSSLVMQAISLVWMELAMFGVAAVVYVAPGVLHGYLELFGDWAYPERWSCPGNMAWMQEKSQLRQEAIWTIYPP